MTLFKESDGCKIHLMQDNEPLVKVLFLKKEGQDQRLVVNKDVVLNGMEITVETWIRNKHGVWQGTPNYIQMFSQRLKAGTAYPFSALVWNHPLASTDRVPEETTY